MWIERVKQMLQVTKQVEIELFEPEVIKYIMDIEGIRK